MERFLKGNYANYSRVLWPHFCLGSLLLIFFHKTPSVLVQLGSQIFYNKPSDCLIFFINRTEKNFTLTQPDLKTKIMKLSLFGFADWLLEPGNNSCVVVHVY